MRHHRSHLLLIALIVTVLLSVIGSSALGAIAAVSAAHFVAAIAIHAAVPLGGAGIAILFMRSRGGGSTVGRLGATIRWAGLYDWMAAMHSFGGERRMRQRTLDLAGVVAGDRVLDVGCGTGTLALAAKERVGVSGSVDGIDASPEMIARARAKSVRSGVPVAFEVAAAQSLPFADATFDVVLCSLAVHHFPEAARAEAFAEMRRVLKPKGRVLIVEFSSGHGLSALLRPVAFLHARRNPRILDRACATLKTAGFDSVAIGTFGFGGLGFVRASRVEEIDQWRPPVS